MEKEKRREKGEINGRTLMGRQTFANTKEIS